ncbi:MAG: hypothetical protein Pg6C_00470 [Treponemataceae bacterium]|nr:MAG: hypothetical protein Pg6C_00470 [Treponemataceae bacterium]
MVDSLSEKPFRGQLLTINEAAKYIRMGGTTFYPPEGKILLDTADLGDWLRVSKVPAGTLLGNI